MFSSMAVRPESSVIAQQPRSVLFFYATGAISTEAPAAVPRSLGQTIEWINEHYPAWQIEALCPAGRPVAQSKAGNVRFHAAELTALDQTWLTLRRKVKWAHRETRWAPRAVQVAAQLGLRPDLTICVSPYVSRSVRQRFPHSKLL